MAFSRQEFPQSGGPGRDENGPLPWRRVWERIWQSARTRTRTRMGAAVRRKDGNYIMLTGNQIGCLLPISCGKAKSSGMLRSSDYIVKSFVSTDLADAIAQHYGIVSYTVMTAFVLLPNSSARKSRRDRSLFSGLRKLRLFGRYICPRQRRCSRCSPVMQGGTVLPPAKPKPA